jgi:hypothetical protein
MLDILAVAGPGTNKIGRCDATFVSPVQFPLAVSAFCYTRIARDRPEKRPAFVPGLMSFFRSSLESGLIFPAL